MSEQAITATLAPREPVTHELKTWQSYFHAINGGSKMFEIRKDDRDFRVGDTLLLRETEYGSGAYTGREARRVITYILRHEEDLGLLSGYAILSLAYCTVSEDELFAKLQADFKERPAAEGERG